MSVKRWCTYAEAEVELGIEQAKRASEDNDPIRPICVYGIGQKPERA